MKSSKSQAAFEFIILAGVMMAIFVMFFAIASSKIAEMNELRRDKVAQDIIDVVMAEIELAHQSLLGYERNFTMPEYIEGNSYEIRINRIGSSNILSLKYQDKLYNYELPVKDIVPGSTVYKGINKIEKGKEGIFVFNGEDPCNDVTIGDKSYCVGGMCYCLHGYYVPGIKFGDPDNICEHEDDFDLPKGKCEEGCINFDHCNPPPGMEPDEPVPYKPKAAVSDITDTIAKLSFTTNESARVSVKYGKFGAYCPDWGALELEKEKDDLEITHEIVLRNMEPRPDPPLPPTTYCFRIEAADSKGAKQKFYEDTFIFDTHSDITPPLISDVALEPPLGPLEGYYFYDDTITLKAKITEYSGIKGIYGIIKLGEYIADIFAMDETHDYGDGTYDYEHEFIINNKFAKHGSYGKDEDTLFYASYDSLYDADFAMGDKTATPNLVVGDIMDGRYGNGIKIASILPDQIDRISYKTLKNFNPDQGTLEFWFKPIATPVLPQYFFYEGETNVFSFFRDGNALVFSIESPGYPGSPWSVYSGTRPLSLGQWYFVAITWNKLNSGSDNGKMYMYFNGDEVAHKVGVKIDLPSGGSNFYVGSYPAGILADADNANAIIDQFRILDKTKSEEDIVKDYEIERTYHIYFEAEDEKDRKGLYGPGGEDYTGTDSFPVNYKKYP